MSSYIILPIIFVSLKDIKLIGSLPPSTTTENKTMEEEEDAASLHRGIQQIIQLNTTFIFSRELVIFVSHEVIPHSGHILMHIENKEWLVYRLVFINFRSMELF